MAHIEKFSITVDTERFWIDGHLASLSPNDLSLNFTTLLERLFKANVTTIKLWRVSTEIDTKYAPVGHCLKFCIALDNNG